MNKYYKNIILCGEIDYYCLLCDEYFENNEQLEKHIRWEQHRKKMKNVSYFRKHKKDFIYKIENYYYCEICNYVTTAAALKDHLNDDTHKSRKTDPTITTDIGALSVVRLTHGGIKCHRLILSELDWHGIVNDYCLLCDTNAEQNIEHIIGAEHMITLIQSKVILIDNECFRKVNETKLYCFSCKISFPNDSTHKHESISEPCTQIEHWTKFSIGESNYYMYTDKILEAADDEDEIFNTLINTQRKFFFIDLDKSEAKCYRCKLVLNDISVKLLISHVKDHILENDESESSDDDCVYSEVIDHGKRRSELAKYGKNNYIKLNAQGSKGFCSLCVVYISASIKVFKQHVRGSTHQGILLAKGLKKGVRHDNQIWFTPGPKPLHSVVTNAQVDKELNVISFNSNIHMDIESFLLIRPLQNKKTKCLICDDTLKNAEVKKHCLSKEHKKKLKDCLIMITNYEPIDLTKEFVRQINTNLYHCGPCNQIIPYWDSTHLHLKSSEHQVTKKSKKLITNLLKRFCGTSMTTVTCRTSEALIEKLGNMGLFKFNLQE
ncbi:uncharacterized protein [Battus philenor]|uniref:uncharacterized protein n=1 Tax=Battus philenor TaxID=42288 RepID=UPI0035CEF2BB